MAAAVAHQTALAPMVTAEQAVNRVEEHTAAQINPVLLGAFTPRSLRSTCSITATCGRAMPPPERPTGRRYAPVRRRSWFRSRRRLRGHPLLRRLSLQSADRRVVA
ncbi:hypothetical protein MSAS_32250 [Mycobacterium saskatchewanense]|nr:hypothetical protein MSAS_32250 [Mycobacterium saskatchewanense]